MPFSARNARYLRISGQTVLPLYIYLDDKHIEWMSDQILQHVLADLRPHIGPKLRTDTALYGSGGAKKGSVDVHRGDGYQFAYFFRKNEPHAVLIKSRKFVPAPAPVPPKAPAAEPQLPKPASKKRKHGEVTTKAATSKAVDGKGSRSGQKDFALSESGDEVVEDYGKPPGPIEGEEPRRSRRAKNLVAGGYKETDQVGSDVEMTEADDQDIHIVSVERQAQSTEATDGNPRVLKVVNDIEPMSAHQAQLEETEISVSVPAPDSGPGFSHIFDVDGEEEKPKLAMRVSYRGFTIYNRCLCVVIEPWPPLRDGSCAPSRAPSLGLDGMRMSSIAPMEHRGRTPVAVRERTPLFLPEIDPRRSLTPAPLPSRILPAVPLFDDPAEPENQGDDTEGGMMAFSQALNSIGDERAGSADEDENEGDVFLGDADERRGEL